MLKKKKVKQGRKNLFSKVLQKLYSFWQPDTTETVRSENMAESMA